MMSSRPTALPPNGGQGYGGLPPEVMRLLGEYELSLRNMRGELEQLKAQAAQAKAAGDSKLAPRYIEDIPGKRAPYWWVIPVDVNSAISEGAQWSGAQTLSQDGPFVINEMRAFWRVTTQSSGADADISRAMSPVSRYPMIIRAATGVAVIDRDIIDWFFNIQISGGDRLWQNSQIPGAVFATDANRPEYMPMPGWIERNTTMTIQAIASVSSTAGNAPDSSARGTLYFVMTGYKILRPIDYAEAFGMNP